MVPWSVNPLSFNRKRAFNTQIPLGIRNPAPSYSTMGGGNGNTTIAFPGPDWRMYWTDEFDNFQLDIVGFLAILGEGAVLANAQVAALSRLFYIPRLMPAPQALLWPNRPSTLPATTASVTAVHSGNVKDHIHHVASVLLENEMPVFTVRCVRVTKRPMPEKDATLIDTLLRGQPKRARRLSDTPELGPPDIKAKASGPLSWVALLGFGLAVLIFILSIVFGDGYSMLASILLSFLSTLVGIGNKWTLKLPQRPKGGKLPDGDVVIRYPNGSYLVVKCSADVARELYFAPEEIEYHIKGVSTYRLISLAGTVMLMGGVICLANARLQLQIAWTGAYVVMNIAHWVAAALPNKLHWDLSCYVVQEESLSTGPNNLTFTEALWKAILLTKSTLWVRNGKAAPQTGVWDAWLAEAEHVASTVEKQEGSLKDPLFLERSFDGSTQGTVWQVPDWDAKSEWDKLNSEFQNVAAGFKSTV